MFELLCFEFSDLRDTFAVFREGRFFGFYIYLQFCVTPQKNFNLMFIVRTS
jgi:hypothetical protein